LMAGSFNFPSIFMFTTRVEADWRPTVDEVLAPLSLHLLPVFIILSIPQVNTIWSRVLGKFHVSKFLFCESLSFSCPCWLSGQCATVLWLLDHDYLDCLERWLKCPQLFVGCTQRVLSLPMSLTECPVCVSPLNSGTRWGIHGTRKNDEDSTEHGTRGHDEDSTEHGTRGNDEDPTEHGTRGHDEESTELGDTMRNSRNSEKRWRFHGTRGHDEDSTEHGTRGNDEDSTEHGTRGHDEESTELGNTVKTPRIY
jgi:hypothetical protein